MTATTFSVDTTSQPAQGKSKPSSSLLTSPQHSLISHFSDDMNEILAPSIDDGEYVDYTDHQSTFLDTLSTIHNTFSADDSILRRVEQEILAARGESDKNNLRNIIMNSTISYEDMEQILQTLTSTEREDETRDPKFIMESDFSTNGSTERMEAASQSSFEHVMDMIDSEFKDDNNEMEATFLGKSELFLHREAPEDEEPEYCPPKNKAGSPSKRGIMDGFVDLLSQGLLRVHFGEGEEKGDEALPTTSTYAEQEHVSEQISKDASALNDKGSPSECNSETVLAAAEVERMSQSDVSSVKTDHSFHGNEVSDHSDEEQAVAKWAQLLAESSPDEGDDASITMTEDTTTALQVADNAALTILGADNVTAPTKEGNGVATAATLSEEAAFEAQDVAVTPALPTEVAPDADGTALTTTCEVKDATTAEVGSMVFADNEFESHPQKIDFEEQEAVLEAEDSEETATQPQEATIKAVDAATDTLGADDVPNAKLGTVESIAIKALLLPQEKGPVGKLTNAVLSKPPLAPSPRLQLQGLSSPSSPSRSLREARKLCAQRDVKYAEKDSTEELHDVSDEQALLKTSRKLRFRKSFPVLKPGRGPRPNDKIIQSNSRGIPTRPTMWIKPKTELKQLIVAAMGTSLQRRSNACGALKVLSLNKKNQMSLARTDTFLTALVFAISQDILDTDREIAIAARIRALTCLRNVCRPKENRIHAFTQPGLIECLMNVINTDKGESRVLACSTLVLLAKSTECREGLGVVTGLVDCLSRVVGRIVASSEEDEEEKAVGDDGDNSIDSESDNSTDSSSESSDGSSSNSSHSSEASETDLGKKSSSVTEDDETESEVKSERMDTDLERLHQDARLNACAVLVHLSRSCAISHVLAKNKTLLRTCVKVTMEIVNPVHSKCLEILRNLTLFPGNCSLLSRADGVITSFTASANSQYSENRISALRALQNLSGDASSKSILASAHVLHLLTSCAIRSDPNEKESAVATLHNITTEPSTVVAITNTRNVIATLVHIAHHTETASNVRLLACEALATTSLWLQTLAGTGKCPESVPNVLLPSHKTYGWERWN